MRHETRCEEREVSQPRPVQMAEGLGGQKSAGSASGCCVSGSSPSSPRARARYLEELGARSFQALCGRCPFQPLLGSQVALESGPPYIWGWAFCLLAWGFPFPVACRVFLFQAVSYTDVSPSHERF